MKLIHHENVKRSVSSINLLFVNDLYINEKVKRSDSSTSLLFVKELYINEKVI